MSICEASSTSSSVTIVLRFFGGSFSSTFSIFGVESGSITKQYSFPKFNLITGPYRCLFCNFLLSLNSSIGISYSESELPSHHSFISRL